MALKQIWEELDHLYTKHIVAAPGVQSQVQILGSFLVTFGITRGVTHLVKAGYLGNAQAGGTHIHHLVPGILLLLITGYIGIGLAPRTRGRWLAILFGIGAALTLDEFALWLHLKDEYWRGPGRESIVAVIVAAAVLGLGIVARAFWWDLVRSIGRRLRG